MDSKQLALDIAKVCDDKRGEDIVLLDMNDVSIIADYFLICQGSNERQVEAIARAIKDEADEQGIDVKRMEGFEHARWILVDLGDIVCHIFHKDERNYYNLERLWGDAPVVEINEL
ncbi:ribosome silencing factor [Aquibacillus sediminis]|uniref:ribosome silencing factor n=1 Tax=Aquibacillus sediminis TaxID=2574734 RepID=UPI0011092445|nr:ribosome silencing factor [Aquibacillus sediminis]